MYRLTLEQAERVRIEAANGASDEDLAYTYIVSERTIQDCRLGLCYRKAGGPITKRTSGGKERLSDEAVRDIRERATDSSVFLKELAEEYGISVPYVSQIVRGVRRASAGGIISEPRNRWFS